jgi:hypothetical protein
MSHSEPTPAAPGRRTARGGRRVALDVTTVLAVLLPVLTVGGMLLVRHHQPATERHDPVETALTSSVLVCPSAAKGAARLSLATAAQDVAGDVGVDEGGHEGSVPVRAGRVSTHDAGAGAVIVRGRDDLAPGLVAARTGTDPVSVGECTEPVPDEWFTGVGAGAGHRSVLELTNPDRGPAIVDVTVYGRSGTIDVPRLRGLSVEGLGTVQVDLATTLPRRDELALHVTATRGRVGVSLLDRFDELGAGAHGQAQLLPQRAPVTSNVLLGATEGDGRQTLVLANPGADEVRATVRIVTEDSVFAPRDIEEIRLAPESVKRVSLAAVLRKTDGALGVVVDSTEPVTATVRSFVGDDLSHAVAVPRVTTQTAVLVPEGPKRLLLTGATRVGVVSVVATGADGQELDRSRTEVTPGRGQVVRLPKGAVLLTITPERASVVGAVQVRGNGTTVVPLRELVRSGLIPDVRPGTS